MVHNPRPNFGLAIGCEDREISNAGFSQGFLLNLIASCCRALIVPDALIFHSQHRPASLINDKDVHPFTVYRMECVVIRRFKNFSEIGLREYPITLAQCPHFLLDYTEDPIFRLVENLFFFELGRRYGEKLRSGVGESTLPIPCRSVPVIWPAKVSFKALSGAQDPPDQEDDDKGYDEPDFGGRLCRVLHAVSSPAD